MSRISLKSTEKCIQDSSFLLQDTIESALNALKDAKKEELMLNKQIKLYQSKLIETLNIKSASAENKELKKLYNTINKQVKTSSNQINTIQSENKIIKEKIEDLRLEINKYKRIIGGLQNDLSYSSNLTRACSQSKLKEMNSEDKTKQKVNYFLNKSINENATALDKIHNISAHIKQDKDGQSILLKKHTNLMQNNINRPLTALDLRNVINSINSIKTHNVLLLKNKYETYKSTHETLKEGFDNIKDALGIGNYLEIAESFIGSEQRMNEIQLYLVKLSADINSIKFSNKSIKSSQNSQKNHNFLEKCTCIKEKISGELRQVKKNLDINILKSKTINEELERAERILDVIII